MSLDPPPKLLLLGIQIKPLSHQCFTGISSAELDAASARFSRPLHRTRNGLAHCCCLVLVDERIVTDNDRDIR